MRHYVGVDWADQTHAIWVVDERGTKITARTAPHTAAVVTVVAQYRKTIDDFVARMPAAWPTRNADERPTLAQCSSVTRIALSAISGFSLRNP